MVRELLAVAVAAVDEEEEKEEEGREMRGLENEGGRRWCSFEMERERSIRCDDGEGDMGMRSEGEEEKG